MGRLVIVIIIVAGIGWFAWRALAPGPTTEQALPGVDVETDEVDVVEQAPQGPPELDVDEVEVDVVRDAGSEESATDVSLDPEERTLDADAEGENESGEAEEEPQR